jgi:hypothetical protein
MRKDKKPKVINMAILDEDGQKIYTFSVDPKLLKKQAKTLGNILSHGLVNAYKFSDAEIEDVTGVWNFLHGILDRVES